MDPSSSPTSWYFVLATFLPILATLLALIWGFYYSSTKKRKSEKQLKGSFGYKFVKSDREEKSSSKSSTEKEQVMNDKRRSSTNREDDKRPLIDDEEDDVIKMSDIEIRNKLEEIAPTPDDQLNSKKQRINSSIIIFFNLFVTTVRFLVHFVKRIIFKDKTDTASDDDNNTEDDNEEFDYTDIPGKLKSSKFVKATKELEKTMTEEQKNEEAEVRHQQLEAIFKLMREQEEKFGMQSNDDLQEQMKLYAL